MGQSFDDIISGTACELCGKFFEGTDAPQAELGCVNGYEHGFPATCWECWERLTKKQKRQHSRALVRTIGSFQP